MSDPHAASCHPLRDTAHNLIRASLDVIMQSKFFNWSCLAIQKRCWTNNKGLGGGLRFTSDALCLCMQPKMRMHSNRCSSFAAQEICLYHDSYTLKETQKYDNRPGTVHMAQVVLYT